MTSALLEEAVGIRLELPSAAENVAVVRAALTAVSESLAFSDELTADVKTVVSEACNNVSLHAYPDGAPGPMRVDIDCLPSGVGAAVIDNGRGITRITPGEDRMGLGLAVISALADRSEFRKLTGGGSEVRMWFERDLSTLGTGSAAHVAAKPPPPHIFAESGGAVVVWCTGQQLQRAVLTRMLASMAAAADFSLDGIAVVRSAAGAVADHVQAGASDGWTGARISRSPRNLKLCVGPLRPSVVDSALLESAESVQTRTLHGHEFLTVTIAGERAA